MATSVLDIDLANPLKEINDLHDYDSAFILVRLQGKPLAQVSLPVIGGRLNSLELKTQIFESSGDRLWSSWLKQSYLKCVDNDRQKHTALPSITIAICTRDRPQDVERCLSKLATLPKIGQQILVVDNAPSTQETFEVVKRNAGVRYVLEDKPGLNVARNRAIQETSTEIIAFVDDDAAPDKDWLTGLCKHFEDQRVQCVTGLVLPLELETKAQVEFERCNPMGKGYQRKVFDGLLDNPLLSGRIGAGANMALRKSIVDEIGLFDNALDCGTPTKSGGDHEYFSRILSAGYKIIYEPEAICWHRHRRDWESLRKTYYGYGVGVYAAWTRSLLVQRELGVINLALGWFWCEQLPKIVSSILNKKDSAPLDLLLAELRGCFVGPFAYLYSRRLYKMNDTQN